MRVCLFSTSPVGTIRKNRLTLDMPTDVFKILFAGKGIGVERGYKEYNPVDFNSKYFPDEWYVHCDLDVLNESSSSIP